MTELISMRLNGGPGILELLDRVPGRFGRNVMRGGANVCAKVIRDEARRNVRKRSGQLARTLKTSTRISGDLITAKVSARGPGSFRAPWIEFSVRPHWITVAAEDLAEVRSRIKSRKQASDKTRMGDLNRMVRDGSLVIGGNFVGPYVYHPGHKAYPFMRPALDNKGAEGINAMGEYVFARLTWASLQAPRLEVIEDEQ